MFKTELILWLQSFESPPLTWALSTVTLLGYTPVYVALVIGLAFGLRLRPSLRVLVALLLAGVLTEALKSISALPRPSDIDARVNEPADSPPVPVLDRGGASSFWGLPIPEAIAAVQSRPDPSYGFPSGHVSLATAFFAGVALFFRLRSVVFFGAVWVPLMAVSRVYLGRHFLADVLGGVGVGALAVVAAALLLRGPDRNRPDKHVAAALAPLSAVSLILLVLTPLFSFLDAENVGRLVGLAVAYALILAPGQPVDRATIRQRCGRVITALVLYLVTSRLIDGLFDATGWEDTRLGSLAAAALLTAATLGGTVAVSRRLGWYLAV